MDSNLDALKGEVDRLVEEIYGSRYGDTPGLKRTVERIDALLKQEQAERDRLYDELTKEKEERNFEKARRQGSVDQRADTWRAVKWVASLFGGGTVLAVLGWLYRQLGGG